MFTRRELIQTIGQAALVTAAAPAIRAAAAPVQAPRVFCLFSKHLPELDWSDLGRAVKDGGFEGVDLTVRPGGHVLPERAAEDLPRAIEALTAQGVQVPMITTDLTSASAPAAQNRSSRRRRGAASSSSRPGTGAIRPRPTCARRWPRRARRSRASPRSPATAASRWGSTITRRISAPRCGISPHSSIASTGAGPATTSTPGMPWRKAAGERGRPRPISWPRGLKMVAVKDCRWVKSEKGLGDRELPSRRRAGRLDVCRQGADRCQVQRPHLAHLEYEIPVRHQAHARRGEARSGLRAAVLGVAVTSQSHCRRPVQEHLDRAMHDEHAPR